MNNLHDIEINESIDSKCEMYSDGLNGHNDHNDHYDQIIINKYILDPLSVIIKLAILSNKKIGCKMCVYNNIMYIQEVGAFQSLVRYCYNNNKVDLQYLYNPIQLACIKYLDELYVNKHPNIKNIFTNAQKGINNLIETYKKFTIITHTLYLYYNIISNYLDNIYNQNLFIDDVMTTYYKPELLEKLNNSWTSERIKIVLNLIEFINNDSDSEKSVKCLEEFMVIIDKEIEPVIIMYLMNYTNIGKKEIII